MANSFKPTDILLPSGVDMTKWSVVACDQFTSEPKYWQESEKIVGDAPSTLNVIFPEIYLGKGEGRIEKINRTMKEYIEKGLFKEYKNTFFLVRRSLKNGRVRNGLVGAIDLEDYSFEKGAKSNIRATEGTVLERIPPRVKIRENALLEFPHIMLLIDDAEKTVVEPLTEKIDDLEKVYDFELMQDGGHISGYNVPEKYRNEVTAAIDKLASETEFEKRYGISGQSCLTFAVGDGNHSLATAKTCWENIKKNLSEDEKKTHPARFALVELVNLHDDSLEFEPIHRVVFDIEPEEMYKAIFNFYPDASENDNGGKKIVCVWDGEEKSVWIKDDNNNLAVGTLQDFVDSYLKTVGGRVDYIHGEDVVRELSKGNNIGFLLPAMRKDELFKTVILDGSLPRKTFSMGEARDKRYYTEGKKLY